MIIVTSMTKLYVRAIIQIRLEQSIQNQKTLETTIEEQNQNLKQTIENQELMIAQVERLQKENMAAQNEVTDIRKKWSRHSLDVLSIRKPQLIQNIINRGTKAVLNDLKQITDENQFDQDVFVPDILRSRTRLIQYWWSGPY